MFCYSWIQRRQRWGGGLQAKRSLEKHWAKRTEDIPQRKFLLKRSRILCKTLCKMCLHTWVQKYSTCSEVSLAPSTQNGIEFGFICAQLIFSSRIETLKDKMFKLRTEVCLGTYFQKQTRTLITHGSIIRKETNKSSPEHLAWPKICPHFPFHHGCPLNENKIILPPLFTTQSSHLLCSIWQFSYWSQR